MPFKSNSNLKQGTLSFSAAKHGAAGKAQGKLSVSASARTPSVEQQKGKDQQQSRKASTSSESSARAASPASCDDDVVMLSSPPTTPFPASVQAPSSSSSDKKSTKRKESLKLSVDTKPISAKAGVKRKLAVDDSSEEEVDEPTTPKGDLASLERSSRLNGSIAKLAKRWATCLQVCDTKVS